MSLASDILRNKALEAVIAGVKAVDEEGNPVELGTVIAEEVVEAVPLEEDWPVRENGIEDDVVEAEIVEQEA